MRFILISTFVFSVTSVSYAKLALPKKPSKAAIAEATNAARESTGPSIGYAAFLSSSNANELFAAGYTGVKHNPDGSIAYEKAPDAAGFVERVVVKSQNGKVAEIVQTIENKKTGEFITNMVNYEDQISSRCTNTKAIKLPAKFRGAAKTECSTVSPSLCSRLTNEQRRNEILPVHQRAMSSQLRELEVKVGKRETKNVLAKDETPRCDRLVADIAVDRMPASTQPDAGAGQQVTTPAVPQTPNLWTSGSAVAK